MVSLMTRKRVWRLAVMALCVSTSVVLLLLDKRSKTDETATVCQPHGQCETNCAVLANGIPAISCQWACVDPHEVLAKPDQIPVDDETVAMFAKIQDELVQAYSNGQVHVLAKWRSKLPDMLEHVPYEQFRGAMLGFIYLVWGDIALADIHPADIHFKDVAELSSDLDIKFSAALLMGDILVKRKLFDKELRSCEGHMLGALRNYEEQFRRDGRADLEEVLCRYRDVWISHIESDCGYTRAVVVQDIAYRRLWGYRFIGEQKWADFIASEIEWSAAYLLKRGKYRPKWMDELVGIPTPNWVGSGRESWYTQNRGNP